MKKADTDGKSDLLEGEVHELVCYCVIGRACHLSTEALLGYLRRVKRLHLRIVEEEPKHQSTWLNRSRDSQRVRR